MKERVSEVNVHHHTKTCKKHQTEWRFDFPRYPSDFTLISQEMPSEVTKNEGETLDAIGFVLKVVKNKLKELHQLCEENKKENKETNVKESEVENTTKKKAKYSIQIEQSLDDILEVCFPEIRFTNDEEFIVVMKEDQKSFKFKTELVKLTMIELGHIELTNMKMSQKVMRSAIYHYSLGRSDHGVKVILRRESNDIFFNNYNPHYTLAWNANMDIQLVLDYFSIITYMCDYVCKQETKTTEMLKEVKKSKEKEKVPTRELMLSLAQAYLTSREIGECEGYWKLDLNLHYKQSNLKTIFVGSGFPEERRHFLRKCQSDKEES